MAQSAVIRTKSVAKKASGHKGKSSDSSRMAGRQNPWPAWSPPNRNWGCVADNLINNSEKVSNSILYNHKNAIVDSGCTNHYFFITTLCTNVEPCAEGIQVKQPDGAIMTATYTALINAPHLPNTVRYAHIFPQMHNKALLSLRKIFDNDYNVKLTRTTISIDHLHDPSMSLHGYRDRTTIMWTVYLSYQELLPEEDSHLL